MVQKMRYPLFLGNSSFLVMMERSKVSRNIQSSPGLKGSSMRLPIETTRFQVIISGCQFSMTEWRYLALEHYPTSSPWTTCVIQGTPGTRALPARLPKWVFSNGMALPQTTLLSSTPFQNNGVAFKTCRRKTMRSSFLELLSLSSGDRVGCS